MLNCSHSREPSATRRLFWLLPVALMMCCLLPSRLSIAHAARIDRRQWPEFDPCRRFALEHAKNKEQTVASYLHVCLELMYAQNPLIFGLGRDSTTYLAINNATVFVEDNLDWIASANLPCAAHCVVPYNYSTVISADGVVLDDAQVPPIDAAALRGRRFDFILVDAPHGHSPGQPGRYQPLKFAAAQLAIDALEYVCLHDMNRDLEKSLFERYFGTPDDILSNGAFGQQLGCKRFKVPRFRN